MTEQYGLDTSGAAEPCADRWRGLLRLTALAAAVAVTVLAVVGSTAAARADAPHQSAPISGPVHVAAGAALDAVRTVVASGESLLS